jgi:hypothetical protein
MTACSVCGSSARLRFDRDHARWICVGSCGTARGTASIPRRRRRQTLFGRLWVDADGSRYRATPAELAEAHRLWRVHADVRGSGA